VTNPSDELVTRGTKPELGSDDFEALAFRARFCTHPPDLLIISKGVHEACFDPFHNALAWEVRVYERLTQTAELLRACLPRTSCGTPLRCR
jgi:hypothetical protein